MLLFNLLNYFISWFSRMGANNWFSDKREDPHQRSIQNPRIDLDHRVTFERESDIEMDSNLDPNFDELYELWSDIPSMSNSLFEFKTIKNYGDDNSFCTAKFYKDSTGETSCLALWLKDYIFSSFMDHTNIIKIRNSFKDPRIYVYDEIKGGTLADLIQKSINSDENILSYEEIWTIIKQIIVSVASLIEWAFDWLRLSVCAIAYS